jgi:hypothetical protein
MDIHYTVTTFPHPNPAHPHQGMPPSQPLSPVGGVNGLTAAFCITSLCGICFAIDTRPNYCQIREKCRKTIIIMKNNPKKNENIANNEK